MPGKIVYNKLLALMESKGLTTYQIRKNKIISESTLQNIRQGKRITTDTIASLCDALDCQSGDILEYVPDNELGISQIAQRHKTLKELS